MRLDEIQQLAREIARLILAEGNAVVDASSILGCSVGCDCCEQIDELAEGEIEVGDLRRAGPEALDAMSSWRDLARPIIAKVLAETTGEDEREVRRALFDAYPFGERAMWPYKVWCDEIRRQRRGPRPRKSGSPRSTDDATGNLF